MHIDATFMRVCARKFYTFSELICIKMEYNHFCVARLVIRYIYLYIARFKGALRFFIILRAHMWIYGHCVEYNSVSARQHFILLIWDV